MTLLSKNGYQIILEMSLCEFVHVVSGKPGKYWGGVINPVLSAFKRVVAPLMGGVAYVA